MAVPVVTIAANSATAATRWETHDHPVAGWVTATAPRTTRATLTTQANGTPVMGVRTAPPSSPPTVVASGHALHRDRSRVRPVLRRVRRRDPAARVPQRARPVRRAAR